MRRRLFCQLLLVWFATALGAACGEGNVCTLIACQSHHIVWLNEEPLEDWTVEVELEPGRAFFSGTCPAGEEAIGLLEEGPSGDPFSRRVECTSRGLWIGGGEVSSTGYYAVVDGVTYGPSTARPHATVMDYPNGPACGWGCKVQYAAMEPNE